VQVPQGMQGGMMLQVQTPAGLVQVQIPTGLLAGQMFQQEFQTQMPAPETSGQGASPPVSEATINVINNSVNVNNNVNTQNTSINVINNNVNVNNVNKKTTTNNMCCCCCCNKERTSIMSEVHPICEWFCGYAALTPSISLGETWQVLCLNCLCQCCQEADEGCILDQHKCWVNCTGCTLCKLGCDCLCLKIVCALPCHKDIPWRITVLYVTVCAAECPPCGCCKTVNHAKVMGGVHGAPMNCEMER